jgi:SAM-dependent methyltransferase
MSESSENLSRFEKITSSLNMQGLGLEIGPSHNPVAPKKENFNVHVLDHLDAEGLKSKYIGHDALGVDVNNIEEVDFVWSGEPLPDLIGKTECYDWIIASHVIEHVPDMIGFLQQCEKLLTPNGKLSLVIPDKRFCFDYLSPLTSAGQFIDAHEQKRTRPSVGQVFDHFANACSQNNAITWVNSPDETASIQVLHPFQQAMDLGLHWIESGDYIDVHCWRFTPESFELLLSDFRKLKLLQLTVDCSFPTYGHEFYVSLSKQAKASDAELDRVKVLRSLIGI